MKLKSLNPKIITTLFSASFCPHTMEERKKAYKCFMEEYFSLLERDVFDGEAKFSVAFPDKHPEFPLVTVSTPNQTFVEQLDLSSAYAKQVQPEKKGFAIMPSLSSIVIENNVIDTAFMQRVINATLKEDILLSEETEVPTNAVELEPNF